MLRFIVPLILCICALALMLLPSSSGLVHDASFLLGGSEITDAIGHVGLFCFLALGWYWALRSRRSMGMSIVLAFALSMAIGTGTELAQGLLPSRGMSLLDFAANWFGAALFAIPFTILWYFTERFDIDSHTAKVSAGGNF